MDRHESDPAVVKAELREMEARLAGLDDEAVEQLARLAFRLS